MPFRLSEGIFLKFFYAIFLAKYRQRFSCKDSVLSFIPFNDDCKILTSTSKIFIENDVLFYVQHFYYSFTIILN